MCSMVCFTNEHNRQTLKINYLVDTHLCYPFSGDVQNVCGENTRNLRVHILAKTST